MFVRRRKKGLTRKKIMQIILCFDVIVFEDNDICSE